MIISNRALKFLLVFLILISLLIAQVVLDVQVHVRVFVGDQHVASVGGKSGDERESNNVHKNGIIDSNVRDMSKEDVIVFAEESRTNNNDDSTSESERVDKGDFSFISVIQIQQR